MAALEAHSLNTFSLSGKHLLHLLGGNLPAEPHQTTDFQDFARWPSSRSRSAAV